MKSAHSNGSRKLQEKIKIILFLISDIVHTYQRSILDLNIHKRIFLQRHYLSVGFQMAVLVQTCCIPIRIHCQHRSRTLCKFCNYQQDLKLKNTFINLFFFITSVVIISATTLIICF